MKRRIIFCLIIVMLFAITVKADTIRWVDFGVPYESLKYAMDVDIKTFDEEKQAGNFFPACSLHYTSALRRCFQ